MHIIVSILKIAGISVLFLFLLLIFLLILLLFVPFRYRISCDKKTLNRKDVEANVTIRFLKVLLVASLKYTKEGLSGTFKILGIPVVHIGKEKPPKKQKREKKSLFKMQKNAQKDKKSIEEESQKKEYHKDKNFKDSFENSIKQKETEKEKESVSWYEEHEKSHQKEKRLWERLRLFYQNIINFWKKLCSGREKIMDVWNNEKVRHGLLILWQQCKYGISHIRPLSCKIRLHFGHSDPAVTGHILGLFSILYAFYGNDIRIEPDFEQPAFDGEAELGGHFQIFVILRIVWKLYRDKEVRYALWKIKNIREEKEEVALKL